MSRLLAGQANDAVPVPGGDAIVLRDAKGEKVLRLIGGRHPVQAMVGVLPSTRAVACQCQTVGSLGFILSI